jgi:cryptochrome
MSTAILWFRKCLRLHDNPALTEICEDEQIDSIIPIFILDPEIVGDQFEKYGNNRLRFLFENLDDLNSRIQKKSENSLLIFWGSPTDAISSLHHTLGTQISVLRSEYCSEPHGRRISELLEKDTPIPSHFHSATHTILDLEETLAQPGFKNPKSMKDIEKIFGSMYPKDTEGFFKIPTPLVEPEHLKNAPDGFSPETLADHFPGEIHSVSSLKEKFSTFGIFESTNSGFYFKGGETEALSRLEHKVSSQPDYVNVFRKPKTCSTNLPNNPSEPSTTGLSPYIAIGSLSVRQLWHEVEKANRLGPHSGPPESLHGQLLFREMFYLLSLSVTNWDSDQDNSMCKKINWGKNDQSKLSAWTDGQTGFPLIDALMRQLDATGWMHHLGRHAVSCFLTRGQLWQHWKEGRDVFDQKLLDSDWALNNANWLWLSGVAPFSMPYFRLYNPCPDGKSSLNVDAVEAGFIRHWVPELKNFPVKYIYEPHLAPSHVQTEAGCIIGKDYPAPILDRKAAAKENLAQFKASLN